MTSAPHACLIEPRPSLAAVAALLREAQLPSSDLTSAHMEHFFHSGPAAAPTGVIGIEIYGSEALLRSLVVHPAHRSIGAGRALVAHAEQYARERGVRSLFLLTTTAEEFFRRQGYLTAGRDTAPASIRATSEFSELCPSTSAFLVKHLAS